MQENEKVSYRFCNKQTALKVAIKLYANELKKNRKFISKHTEIDNIKHEADNETNETKLINLYIKLKNIELREENAAENAKLKAEYDKKLAKYEKDKAENDAKYQNELNAACNELRNSTRSIAAKLNEIQSHYDIFYYARSKRTQAENKKLWQELVDSMLNTKYYDEVVEVYKKMQTFVTEIIQDYEKSRGDYYRNHIEMPTFLKPKDVVKKTIVAPTLEEMSFQSAKYDNALEILDEVFDDKYCIDENTANNNLAFPTIIDYDNNRKFINQDLITTPDKIENSDFFKAALSAMNKKINSILNAYEDAQETRGYLTQEQEELNKRVANVIAKRFNTLYGKSGSDAYRFDIKLDKEEISLSIFKGDDVVVLDNQSTGFKWFFNLYFNLLNGKILKSGDIVLMDEPAHNLSPKARKECAEFLRKYGEENGITFVIVTHDLFWIDSDFLNEVRIIKNREDKELKGVSIQNDFSRIQSSDTDTFLEIKRAFGVDMHVFYPPNVRLVFVEGITDYNYLSAFKLLLQKERNEELDIVFLPICGLGKDSSEKAIVLEKLMGQCKDPILLVDSDEASKEIENIKQEKGYDKLDIIKLSEIDSKFKEIESLFSKKDYEKYGLEKKSSGISSAFKKHILWAKDDESAKDERLEKTTKDNFYKVLEHLLKNL